MRCAKEQQGSVERAEGAENVADQTPNAAAVFASSSGSSIGGPASCAFESRRLALRSSQF